MTTGQQTAALEGLLSRVQTIVAETGVGPDDDALLVAFRDFPDGDPGATTRELRAHIAPRPIVVAEQIPHSVASRVPGGTLVHKAVARATRRQAEALLTEIRGLASQIQDRLLELTDAAPPPLTRSVEQATSQIQTIADTVATLEERLAALERRLESPEPSS